MNTIILKQTIKQTSQVFLLLLFVFSFHTMLANDKEETCKENSFFHPGAIDVELSNCGGGTYSGRFFWTNPATSGWSIQLAETNGFWPVETHAISWGNTERWVTLTAGRQYCYRLQYGPNGADAVYGTCFTDNDCGGGSNAGPTNLRLEQKPSGCQNNNYGLKFEWDGQGTNWWLDVDTDQCFDGNNSGCSAIGGWWNHNVSNLGNLNSGGIFTLQPGQTYYWRIWDGSTHIYPNAAHASWNVPTCTTTPPTNLSVSYSGCTATKYNATFNWNNAAGSGWQIHLAANGGFYPVDNHNITSGTTSHTVYGLNKNRDYCWRIQYGSNGSDAAYGPGCFNETNACPPIVTPTNLHEDYGNVSCVNPGGTYSVTFKWSGAASNNWFIQYGNGNFNQTAAIGNNATQKTINGFYPDVNYKWRIKYGTNYSSARSFNRSTCVGQTECYPVYGIHWWEP